MFLFGENGWDFSVLKFGPWGNFSHLYNSCPDAMPVLVNERCVCSMTQLLCFSFRESDCTAASTASTCLSSSKYLPPPLSICVCSLLSRWMIAYSWRVHIQPMTYTPFRNGWTNTRAAKNGSPQNLSPFPAWTSSQAWAAVGSCVQHSSQVESDRLSRAGGLYEVALKGLRRATNYEHLSFNPHSVTDKQNLCLWSHPQSTLNTYTLSHFHVSICSAHTTHGEI